jgi:hypothetical protein
MNEMGFLVAQWIVLVFFNGGVGLPLGIPPGQEDPVLARLAPEKCLFCLTWNGTAKPDPKSKNQTEQLLAEPEIQKLDKMPKVFLSPGSKAAPGKTRYLTVRGPGTVFPGAKPVRVDAIRDGVSNTVMLVEVNDALAVEWTRPDDFQPDPQQPSKGLERTWSGTFLAGFADGSVQQIALSVDPVVLKALFTRAGGEVVNLPQ